MLSIVKIQSYRSLQQHQIRCNDQQIVVSYAVTVLQMQQVIHTTVYIQYKTLSYNTLGDSSLHTVGQLITLSSPQVAGTHILKLSTHRQIILPTSYVVAAARLHYLFVSTHTVGRLKRMHSSCPNSTGYAYAYCMQQLHNARGRVDMQVCTTRNKTHMTT